ncbi:hypothetical protein QG37_06688 [Candidozyma auris]|nr:hypothetical protein QG37_06688 [[Candida] auris]
MSFASWYGDSKESPEQPSATAKAHQENQAQLCFVVSAEPRRAEICHSAWFVVTVKRLERCSGAVVHCESENMKSWIKGHLCLQL